MVTTAGVWLYIRGNRSVRIEICDASLLVYGPGDQFRRHDYGDDVTARLEHSSLEQELVRDGWSLERMTMERRSGTDRRARTRGRDRRGLRLVPQCDTGSE